MKRVTALFISFCFFTSAFAFRIEYGNNLTISHPVYEDLYIAGGNILINAPVYGDLVVAGGTVTINDSVSNDILLAAGQVNINGFVGDDIRCAGGTLRILKNITGDVIIAGGTIIIDKGVSIGGLISSGGEITIDGTILTNVKAASGRFVLNGMVMKDFDCRGATITINGVIQGKAIVVASNKIIIGDNAEFKNEVRYWAPSKVDFKKSLKNGNAIPDDTLKANYTSRWYYLGFSALWVLLWYIGMAFLMILIIQYLFSKTMKRAGDAVYNSTLRSLGFGLLFFVALPVISIIAFITIIGVPVGILLLLGFIILLLLATSITSVVVANWLNNLRKMQFNFWRISFSALGIFILLKILTFTPFLGWLVMVCLVLISFGAILINIHWRKNINSR
jgi:cytoskeletal protein CcmA (bactofilin family)